MLFAGIFIKVISLMWVLHPFVYIADNESLKERREMLAMAIGIPAGIIFCILIIGLIAAVCYCIKRRKLEKDRKEYDHPSK